MSKNIKTQEAKLDLITKFLDYANVADASYAMLQYIWENAEQDEKNNIYKADKLTFGDKLKQDIVMKNSKGEDIAKPKNTNTAYACAIQARFEQSKIIRIESKYCIPFTDTYFFHKEITLDNDISKVGLNDTLSKRTIDFVNRFKLLKHQPNTTSGFSATLFEDTKDNNQKIIVIRGTEPKSNFGVDILDADVDLALGKVPYNQYLDMIKFYSECVKEFPNIKEDRGLIIVGHSLGGALAQLLTLSLASVNSSANVKEIYTFNSPGAKELKALNLNQIYNIDEKIINSDNKEQALFYQIRSYKYQKSIEISLIGYDSNLFQNIKSYFHNKKNLKEHYIFIKTNIIYGKSTSYFYDIFEVDEVFINCVNQLLTNLNTKNILATSDNTYHIETDTDSDASNAKGVIQDLGVDIDGKHYIINLGDQFWDSHFLEPTIIELNYILNLMKNKEIDNLLEYNINKDKEELRTFIKYHNNVLATARTRYDDYILSYFSIPKPSSDFSNSLEYLQVHYLPKEPQKPLFAANIQGFSSTQLQALEEYKIKKAKYDDELKGYKFYKVKYERERQVFNQKFKEHFSRIIFYQNRLYSHKKTQEKIIVNAIIQQINQKDIAYFNLYSVIEFLKENKAYYKYIVLNEIQDLILNDLDNKLGYFYCLYVCINSIVLREDKNTYFTQATAINNLGYSNDFTKIFILDKENLNDTYLDARKKLYKSINTLKEERNEKIKNIQAYLDKENSLQDNPNNQSFNTEENDVNLALNEVFNIEQFYDKNTNTIVLKTNNIKIIFLDKVNLQDLQDNTNTTSFISMSNLIHIYDNHCDIFTKDRSVLDIKVIEEKYHIDFKSLDTNIFLNSTLLTGSTELPNNPFYFGELDKDNIIKQDRPSYYFSPKDESSGLGRLSIFYKNDELCLLNYSIIENSLNIKLECLSKQSLEYKDLISNTIKEQKTTQVDKKQSIAKLHALLENQNLEC
ncbi:lipase family protein, partial [Campylobacter cuniculorum]|uniref:lipase family protein n=1 Tax=Campylobacter cuniculorum TaxID=374106 RepID=UPI001F0B5DB2